MYWYTIDLVEDLWSWGAVYALVGVCWGLDILGGGCLLEGYEILDLVGLLV